MNYRTLGRTGLRVSEIGFGCGNVGGLMVRGTPAEQVAAVKRAMDLGIDYFDTAPQYGNGLSETNLGQVLKQISRPFTLATKVTVGPGDVSDLKGTIGASVETSLRRLGRDKLDVLQLHTPITVGRGGGRGWSLGVGDVLGPHGVVEAFESVRSRGLVRFLGFTGLGDTGITHRGWKRPVRGGAGVLQPAKPKRRGKCTGGIRRSGLPETDRSRRGEGHGGGGDTSHGRRGPRRPGGADGSRLTRRRGGTGRGCRV
jgi:hypothetical protein